MRKLILKWLGLYTKEEVVDLVNAVQKQTFLILREEIKEEINKKYV